MSSVFHDQKETNVSLINSNMRIILFIIVTLCPKLHFMKLTENFLLAAEDYRFLLEKKYPGKAIHELVSTRYALNHFERSILYRGVTTNETAGKRISRLITIEQLNNEILHIDLFNVLFTLAAYLRGFPVYRAMDGLVRDASEGHDSNEWVEHLEKALDLLLKHLDETEPEKIIFYLDNPLHLSGYLAREIEKKRAILTTPVEILSDDSPDHLIRSAAVGILATSDSTIIDKSGLPVFDLPGYVLKREFDKDVPPI